VDGLGAKKKGVKRKKRRRQTCNKRSFKETQKTGKALKLAGDLTQRNPYRAKGGGRVGEMRWGATGEYRAGRGRKVGGGQC